MRGRVAAAVVVGPLLVTLLLLSAAARRPPLDLEVVELLALEIAALLAAVGAILLATAMRRRLAPPSSRGLGWPTVAVLAGGLLLAALSAGLTLGGLEPPLAVDGGGAGGLGGGTPEGDGDPATLVDAGLTSPWVVVVLLAVVAVGILAVRAWRTTHERPPAAAGGRAADVAAAAAAGRHAVATVGAGNRAAVLAAFAAVEDALADAGAPRRPTETQDEYVLRVLTEHDAPADSVATLADAYRVARWTLAPVDDALRDRAESALAAVVADLTARP